MDSKKSPSGLWKRQSSTPIGDDTTNNAGGGVDDSALELASTSGGSVDNAPLLATSSSTQGSGAVATTTTSEILSLSSSELAKITCRDIGLSFAFNFLGSSLTHVFAAAEDEAWRSENVPFQKTAAGDVILDFELNHKLVDPATVSGPMLYYTVLLLPLLFLVAFNVWSYWEPQQQQQQQQSSSSSSRSRILFIHPMQWHELRATLCAFFVSFGLSETVTSILKLYVSRHRPNFYALCGFDVSQLKCMDPSLKRVHEATLSFPSGHSSLSFCGMTFLMLFLLGRLALLTTTTTTPSSTTRKVMIQFLQTHKSFAGVLCCIVPWSYSFFVASSRVVDKWHHPSDVIAGTLIGIASATIGYHAFYPSTLSSFYKAGVPLSLQPQPQQALLLSINNSNNNNLSMV